MIGIQIFETDSTDILPEQINADMVVVGNKHKYSFDNVKSKFTKKNIVQIDFS